MFCLETYEQFFGILTLCSAVSSAVNQDTKVAEGYGRDEVQEDIYQQYTNLLSCKRKVYAFDASHMVIQTLRTKSFPKNEGISIVTEKHYHSISNESWFLQARPFKLCL